MGRPTTSPRDVNLKIRLSQKENEMLEKYCAETGSTKTDVIVKGIALVCKELQTQND